MPYVERSVVVAADVETVYRLAKKMEDFPQYMPDVKNVTVIEEDENGTVTRWQVHVIGRDLKWTERDIFDDKTPKITYKQIEGDVKKFEGEWRFVPERGGVRVELTCDAELGVPMLDAIFNPVLKKALEINVDKMLAAIKAKAESATGGLKSP